MMKLAVNNNESLVQTNIVKEQLAFAEQFMVLDLWRYTYTTPFVEDRKYKAFYQLVMVMHLECKALKLPHDSTVMILHTDSPNPPNNDHWCMSPYTMFQRRSIPVNKITSSIELEFHELPMNLTGPSNKSNVTGIITLHCRAVVNASFTRPIGLTLETAATTLIRAMFGA